MHAVFECWLGDGKRIWRMPRTGSAAFKAETMSSRRGKWQSAIDSKIGKCTPASRWSKPCTVAQHVSIGMGKRWT